METDAIVVLCTTPDDGTAARLARGLVESNLAACVQRIAGLRSTYRWKGEIHDESEIQLLIKTRRGCFNEVKEWLRKEHPYEVPEILALQVVEGDAQYLEWLEGQTQSV